MDQPDQPIDPKKDQRIQFGCYGIASSSIDGSLWCTGIGVKDTKLVRIERGPNPPQSSKAEVYVPPADKMPLPRSGAWPSTQTAWSVRTGGEPIK